MWKRSLAEAGNSYDASLDQVGEHFRIASSLRPAVLKFADDHIDDGDTLTYLEDGMEEVCEVVLYEGKAISVELPTIVVREVAYTEPAAKGDTSGKVMKVARLNNGQEVQVAAFVEIGDRIEIDTRTGEFKKRA